MEKINNSPDYKGKPLIGFVGLFLGALVLLSYWPPVNLPAQIAPPETLQRPAIDSAGILEQQAKQYKEEKRLIDSANMQQAVELKRLTRQLRRQNNNTGSTNGPCELYGLLIRSASSVDYVPVKVYKGYAIAEVEDIVGIVPPIVKHDTFFIPVHDADRRPSGLWQKFKNIVSPRSKKKL